MVKILATFDMTSVSFTDMLLFYNIDYSRTSLSQIHSDQSQSRITKIELTGKYEKQKSKDDTFTERPFYIEENTIKIVTCKLLLRQFKASLVSCTIIYFSWHKKLEQNIRCQTWWCIDSQQNNFGRQMHTFKYFVAPGTKKLEGPIFKKYTIFPCSFLTSSVLWLHCCKQLWYGHPYFVFSKLVLEGSVTYNKILKSV